MQYCESLSRNYKLEYSTLTRVVMVIKVLALGIWYITVLQDPRLHVRRRGRVTSGNQTTRRVTMHKEGKFSLVQVVCIVL